MPHAGSHQPCDDSLRFRAIKMLLHEKKGFETKSWMQGHLGAQEEWASCQSQQISSMSSPTVVWALISKPARRSTEVICRAGCCPTHSPTKQSLKDSGQICWSFGNRAWPSCAEQGSAFWWSLTEMVAVNQEEQCGVRAFYEGSASASPGCALLMRRVRHPI